MDKQNERTNELQQAGVSEASPETDRVCFSNKEIHCESKTGTAKHDEEGMYQRLQLCEERQRCLVLSRIRKLSMRLSLINLSST